MASIAKADTSATTETTDNEGAARNFYTVAGGRTVGSKGPGEQVELDDNDAKRFRELGFILDEDGGQRFSTGGPAVHVEDGVQIKPAV